MPAKPSPAQLRFILAILERGGTNVASTKLFTDNGGITAAVVTLESCRQHGWVVRVEGDYGVAYWSVTLDGRADAEGVDPAAVAMAISRGRLRMTPLIVG